MRVIYEDGSAKIHKLRLQSGKINSSLTDPENKPDIDTLLEDFLRGPNTEETPGEKPTTDSDSEENDPKDWFKDAINGLGMFDRTPTENNSILRETNDEVYSH